MFAVLTCLLACVAMHKVMPFSIFNTTKLADTKTNGDEPAIDSTLSLLKAKFMDLFTTAEYMSEVIPPANTFVPYNMMMDVRETDKTFEMIVDLPGVEKKDIHIHIDRNHLTINAERLTHQSEDHHNYKKTERFSGRISRSIHVPDSIDQSRIQAESNNGILFVTMPKVEEGFSMSSEVEVK